MDEETGYYNYGVRYYDPSLSLWTGVDPLAYKGPNWSPYNYTFNNPVRFIDPDGRWPWPGFGTTLLEYVSRVKFSGSISRTKNTVGVRGKIAGYGAGLNIDYGETRNTSEAKWENGIGSFDQYEDNNPNYGASANFHVVTVATGVEVSEGDDPKLLETTFSGQVGPVGVTISPDANNHSSDKMPPVSEVKLEVLNLDIGLHWGIEIDVALKISTKKDN